MGMRDPVTSRTIPIKCLCPMVIIRCTHLLKILFCQDQISLNLSEEGFVIQSLQKHNRLKQPAKVTLNVIGFCLRAPLL